MRVGSLVKEKHPSKYEVGYGIVIKDFGKTVWIQWANMNVLTVEHREYLEVLCE